jgi:hypothetical protein
MVLKPKMRGLLFLPFLFFCQPGRASYDSTAYNQALKLHRSNKETLALQKLEKNYAFGRKDLPLEVSALAAGIAASLKDWPKAERIADQAIQAHDPKWAVNSSTSEKLAGYLKSQPKTFLTLVQATAEAKTQIYVATNLDLDEESRQKKKEQAKIDFEALTQIGFKSDNAQENLSRVQDREKQDVLDEYKLSLFASLSYWTWEDRVPFSVTTRAHATFYTPCLGLGAHYTNDFYQWSGGACIGVGVGELVFSDGTFDNHASITLLNGFVSGLLKLSDSGAGIGIEGDIMSSSITGTTAGGIGVSTESEEFAALLVGRMRFSSVDVKLKGGTIFGNPGALWEVELSYPFMDF